MKGVSGEGEGQQGGLYGAGGSAKELGKESGALGCFYDIP